MREICDTPAHAASTPNSLTVYQWLPESHYAYMRISRPGPSVALPIAPAKIVRASLVSILHTRQFSAPSSLKPCVYAESSLVHSMTFVES